MQLHLWRSHPHLDNCGNDDCVTLYQRQLTAKLHVVGEKVNRFFKLSAGTNSSLAVALSVVLRT
jgi:hypothetical protein